MKDLYEILGVDRSANGGEIKRQYRRLAKKYHPDVNPGDDEAQEKFKEINMAYEILSDKDKRRQYDTYGMDAFKNGGQGGGFSGMDFGDIFGDIFGDFFGGGFGQQRKYDHNAPRKGSDIEQQIHLTFEEAVFGVEKEIRIQRIINCENCHGSGAEPGTDKKVCGKCHGSGEVHYQQNTGFGTFVRTTVCDECGGTGEIIEKKCHECKGRKKIRVNKTIHVKIPAGVDNGSIINLRGEGNEGDNQGPSGDLYIIITVKEHEFFQRQGSDIYYELPISFVQASLGAKLKVPTLDGITNFDLPAGTQTGTRFTLENEGVQKLRGKGKGNIYFDVRVLVPKKLSKKQKEILKEFSEASGDFYEEHEEKKGFFEKLIGKFES
ncbi:MAG: molecular chaperone DnaJ [Tissierellia bacterium]|nr:molecular chaperone DnaJ [Tissierellia bacterium]